MHSSIHHGKICEYVYLWAIHYPHFVTTETFRQCYKNDGIALFKLFDKAIGSFSCSK